MCKPIRKHVIHLYGQNGAFMLFKNMPTPHHPTSGYVHCAPAQGNTEMCGRLPEDSSSGASMNK